MWHDPIVAEVRKIREAYVEQFNGDLQALYYALKAHEERSTRPKASFPPKRVTFPQSQSTKTSRQPQFVYDAPQGSYVE
ncbi:MAG TPA: hypothetical protein PKZ84_10840 [Anaerolineae bacterium]|nr:hypothetical protein [Anaerolineae bacterium]HQI86198.1 hypothetical protein [Anaerolineae bacterium]